jgi:hypothetical protein
MNEKIFTFSSLEQGSNWVSIGFGVIAALGIFVLLYQLNNRVIKRSASEIASTPIVILVFLATLLATGAFLYSIRSAKQLGSVSISSDEIRTPFGSVKTQQVKSVYFYPTVDLKTLEEKSESGEEIYLIIEQANGYKHPLSSKACDIKAIYNAWTSLQQSPQ